MFGRRFDGSQYRAAASYAVMPLAASPFVGHAHRSSSRSKGTRHVTGGTAVLASGVADGRTGHVRPENTLTRTTTLLDRAGAPASMAAMNRTFPR